MKKWWHMRSCSYVFLFLVMIVFSGRFFSKFKNSFIYHNLTFFVYLILFAISLLWYYQEIGEGFRTINKSSVNSLLNIGLITFFAEALCGIVLSLGLHIENLNQSSLDSDVCGNTFLLSVASVLFAPVAEEIMFRFCIFSFFPKNKIIASVISALLFSFMHVWNYVIIDKNILQLAAMLPYIALGTGLCVLYSKTENICLPILLHMGINFIARVA